MALDLIDKMKLTNFKNELAHRTSSNNSGNEIILWIQSALAQLGAISIMMLAPRSLEFIISHHMLFINGNISEDN